MLSKHLPLAACCGTGTELIWRSSGLTSLPLTLLGSGQTSTYYITSFFMPSSMVFMFVQVFPSPGGGFIRFLSLQLLEVEVSRAHVLASSDKNLTSSTFSHSFTGCCPVKPIHKRQDTNPRVKQSQHSQKRSGSSHCSHALKLSLPGPVPAAQLCDHACFCPHPLGLCRHHSSWQVRCWVLVKELCPPKGAMSPTEPVLS